MKPWLPDLARNFAQSIGTPRAAPEPDAVEAPPPADALPVGALRILEDEYSDRRSAPRHEAEVEGRLQLPTAEHDCRILDLSTGGMSVVAQEAVLMPGMQVAVLAQSLPALVGTVRWSRSDGAFGVQFTRPIAASVIEKIGQLKRRIRSPRARRANLELPCVIWFDGIRYPVMVSNISVGGLMMIDPQPPMRGQRRLIRRGQPLMMHFPEMLPVGGHVRWTLGAKIGVMFTKLLPIAMAEEIQRISGLPIAWVDDVRQAHIDLDGARGGTPSWSD